MTSLLKLEFEKTLKAVENAERILITGTASADGDSVGSQLSLYHIIKHIRPDVDIDIVNEQRCPERYQFLPSSDLIKSIEGSKVAVKEYDLGFVLDGGSERSGGVEPYFNHIGVRVLVDHHKYGSPASYEIKLEDPRASATAEILWDLIHVAGVQELITREIAAQLYLAIAFDTGSFRFPLTTPKTMLIAADLMATGIDFSWLQYKGIDEATIAAKRLLAYCLTHMTFFDRDKIVFAVLTQNTFKSVEAQEGDQEKIINHLINISGVEAAALLLQTKASEWKISFRSKGLVDCGWVARSLTADGGGHARAAGCTLKGKINETLEWVMSGLCSGLAHPNDPRLP